MVVIKKYSVQLVQESSKKYDCPKKISSPGDMAVVVREVMNLQFQSREKFCIACLDTKNHVIGIHVVSVGNLNSSIVHPREVFQDAILNNAASIILFHNHPSGDTKPSREDINVTERLVEVGDIMGIKVLDHLIIGDGHYLSFKEENII